jgi:amidohydrolase
MVATASPTAPWAERIPAAVDAVAGRIVAASRSIHARPEVAFQERYACALLTGELEQGGFRVTRGIGGLETAFLAELAGAAPGPTVAVLAEYDALPEIGHGCGHNVIGAAAMGAGLALAASAGDFAGRLVVIGTPAEERVGGKILLGEAGVFDGVDAAIMVHPATRTMVDRGSLAHSRCEIIFHGKAAHAATSPDQGINALHAVIQTFVGINARRPHLRADAKVHGIITHGGDAPNVIPARASALFVVRALDRDYQRTLAKLLRDVAEGAALATGARLEWIERRGCANLVPNEVLGETMARRMRELGLAVVPAPDYGKMGSTDMGDVSQLVPSIHAFIAMAPPGTPGHSVELRAVAASEAGDRAALDAAKCLAMTAADLLADPTLVDRAKAEYQDALAAGRVAGWEAWHAGGQRYTPYAL